MPPPTLDTADGAANEPWPAGEVRDGAAVGAGAGEVLFTGVGAGAGRGLVATATAGGELAGVGDAAMAGEGAMQAASAMTPATAKDRSHDWADMRRA